MNDKTQAIIDDLENTNITVEYKETIKTNKVSFDVIIIDFDAYSQEGVIGGILEDHGFNSDLQNYIWDNIGQTETSDPTCIKICLEY